MFGDFPIKIDKTLIDKLNALADDMHNASLTLEKIRVLLDDQNKLLKKR